MYYFFIPKKDKNYSILYMIHDCKQIDTNRYVLQFDHLSLLK